MTLSQLIAVAENIVAMTQRKMPPDLRKKAETLPVIYHDWPSDEILGAEFEPDILGMFVGLPLGIPPGDGNEPPAHILLFVENIWDFSEGVDATYRNEVKLTYLHELGHYFGWDEEEVAARGLD